MGDIKQLDLNLENDLPKIQLKAQDNKSNPGSPIFIREDGKIGFSTANSIEFSIGDTVRGVVVIDNDKYFMVQVREVV